MTDPAWFERFLRETEGALRAYVAGIGVGRDAVDEVAQEAYVALWLRGDDRPADVEAWPWLKGIARHKALHHLQRRTRRRSRLVELLSDGAAAADDEPRDDEALGALRACLAELGDDARRVLDLHYAGQLSSDRIAARLARAASTVRKQLLRLRAALAECIRLRLEDGRG